MLIKIFSAPLPPHTQHALKFSQFAKYYYEINLKGCLNSGCVCAKYCLTHTECVQRFWRILSVHIIFLACTQHALKKQKGKYQPQNKPFFPDPESTTQIKTGERSKFHTWASLRTNAQYIKQSTVLIHEPLSV